MGLLELCTGLDELDGAGEDCGFCSGLLDEEFSFSGTELSSGFEDDCGASGSDELTGADELSAGSLSSRISTLYELLEVTELLEEPLENCSSGVVLAQLHEEAANTASITAAVPITAIRLFFI